MLNPGARKPAAHGPAVHLVEITANGEPVNLARMARLGPESERLQIRYTGIHLSAPERVRYSYWLEGLDRGMGGGRRAARDQLQQPAPRPVPFTRVRADLAGRPGASEQSYGFEVLPRFYETDWFRALCAAALLACRWAVYQLRLRQIRSPQFALVLEERGRLAR